MLVGESKTGKPKQTWAERTVKPMSKVRNKTMSPLRINNTEVLIMLLTKMLNNNWKKDQISVFLISINQENTSNMGFDQLRILTTFFQNANSTNPTNFVFVTQLDIKKSETY